MMSINKMIKRIFTALFCAVMVLPIEAQNITKPKIACPNDFWVNSYNGVLFFTRIDLQTVNSALPMQVQFYYNSSYSSKNYGYGAGFSLGYEMRYVTDSLGIVIERGDGRKDLYTQYGQVYEAPEGVFDKLTQYEEGKYLLTMKEGTKYYFDDAARGQVTKISSRNGNLISLNYQEGLLTRISDSYGRTVTLSYNNSLLARVSASFANGDVSYQYDSKERLIKVTDAMGYSTLYAYDDQNRLIVMTDPNGNKTQITYTGSGAVNRVRTAVTDKVIRYETEALRTVILDYMEPATQFSYYKWDAKGRVIEKNGLCCGIQEALEYDNDDNVIRRTDANGNSRTFTYDNNGNRLTATDAQGNTEKYTYEPTYNQLATYTDKRGGVYRFTYDDKGNLTQLSGPEGFINSYTYSEQGLPLTVTDARGNVTQNAYTLAGMLTSQTDAAGNVRNFTYDVAGNLLTSTDARRFSTTYTYNKNNWLTRITNSLQNNTELSYDHRGNVVRVRDAANRITANAYDPLGRLLVTTDVTGKTVRYAYNGKGKPTTIVNQAGDTVRMNYDSRDRMISMTNPANESIAFEYDKKGNLIGITQPNGNVISYGYTANDWMDIVNDTEGLISKQTYDANGNVLTREDAEGRITSYQYDALNRTVRVTDPSGNSEQYAYDPNSNVVSYTNRNEKVEAYAYDALNRLTELTDVLLNKTKYQYDGEGNLTTATDAKNNATGYTYDALGRNTHITFANGTTTEYGYDALGNLIRMRDRNGAETKFLYDALNQLVTKLYSNGKSDRFAYSEIGQLISAVNENATVTFSYDKAGRVRGESLNGKSTAYSYDLANRKRTITYPSNKSVEEQMNGRNQIVQISEDGTIVVNMAYAKSGELLSRTYGNGASTQFAYNENGWLARMTDGPNISDVALAYDKMGNITSRTDLLRPTNSEQYVYDELQRLVQFARGTINNGTIANPLKGIGFRYDALGNRVSTQEDGVSTNYTTDAMNQYTAISGGITAALQYDKNGNMLNDANHSYRYDLNNKLIQVDNNTANYLYDALGRRISKITNEGKLDDYYAGIQVIEERNGANAVLATYLFGNSIDDVLKMNRTNSSYYYHKNHLGSAMAITGEGAALQESYLYHPFGETAFMDAAGHSIQQSAIGNTALFTGRSYDSETGNYDYRARTMSPAMGRFIQPDPLMYVDGMNYYSYVKNNPLMYVDPMGLNGDCSSDPESDFCEQHPFICAIQGEAHGEGCIVGGIGLCADVNISINKEGVNIGGGLTPAVGLAATLGGGAGSGFNLSKNDGPEISFRANGGIELGAGFGGEYSYNLMTGDHDLSGTVGVVTLKGSTNGSTSVGADGGIGGGAFAGIRIGGSKTIHKW